jgi:hypothetical protein
MQKARPGFFLPAILPPSQGQRKAVTAQAPRALIHTDARPPQPDTQIRAEHDAEHPDLYVANRRSHAADLRQIGGYLATAVTSDIYAVRLALQGMSEPSADSAQGNPPAARKQFWRPGGGGTTTATRSRPSG